MQIAMTPSAKALSASAAAALKGVMVVPQEDFVALAIGLARLQEAERGTRFAVAEGKRGDCTPWQFRSCTLVGLTLICGVPLAVWPQL